MMFSTSSPTYPASVSVVASAMQNGTSRIFASVLASKVLPDPVGPIRRILLFSISTSANGSGWKAADESVGAPACMTRLKWLWTATERVFFAMSCPMTYWSRDRRISAGLGTRIVDDCRRASSFSSLSRMLLQTLMQLSQIYTPGPAMSLRTSAWLLPQKEHMVRLEARAISGG